jgi:hypothetical protein
MIQQTVRSLIVLAVITASFSVALPVPQAAPLFYKFMSAVLSRNLTEAGELLSTNFVGLVGGWPGTNGSQLNKEQFIAHNAVWQGTWSSNASRFSPQYVVPSYLNVAVVASITWFGPGGEPVVGNDVLYVVTVATDGSSIVRWFELSGLLQPPNGPDMKRVWQTMILGGNERNAAAISSQLSSTAYVVEWPLNSSTQPPIQNASAFIGSLSKRFAQQKASAVTAWTSVAACRYVWSVWQSATFDWSNNTRISLMVSFIELDERLRVRWYELWSA